VTEKISPKQFRESKGVEDWRILGSDGACAYFSTKSLAESAKLVQAISGIPGIDTDRVAIDVRNDGLTVSLVTFMPGYMGMTTRDVELATQISAAAKKLGLTADPSKVQSYLVIPGATDIKTVMPFWRAALGYEPRADSPDEDLVDPRGRGPGLWFENMKEPRGDGGGAIHFVVWVPFEQAKARVAAALAAGGRMVHDDNEPSWWTLADPAGNEVDIATTHGRE
jgi:4a-hydroxytetrahydrobiopterin dehydratase